MKKLKKTVIADLIRNLINARTELVAILVLLLTTIVYSQPTNSVISFIEVVNGKERLATVQSNKPLPVKIEGADINIGNVAVAIDTNAQHYNNQLTRELLASISNLKSVIEQPQLDSGLFVTKSQLDAAVAKMLWLPVYYLDTLNTRIYNNNLYQPKGNYLTATDTLDKWQPKGTYLVPNDTLNKWQLKITNGETGKVWKMLSSTAQGWGDDLQGSGGGSVDLSEYVTNTNLSNILYDYATQSWVATQINNISVNGGGGITVEADPIFNSSVARNITSADTTNWNNAYNWGNHASEGYLRDIDLSGYVTTEELNTRLLAKADATHTHDDYLTNSDFENFINHGLDIYVTMEDLENYVPMNTLDDYATTDWVNTQLQGLSVDGSGSIDLSDYVTQANLDSVKANRALINHIHSNYLQTDDLNNYITKAVFLEALDNIITVPNLPDYLGDYVTNTELQTQIDNLTFEPPDLSDYVTQTDLDSVKNNRAYANHTHTDYLQESDLSDYVTQSNLDTVKDNRALINHVHNFNDVTGLADSLNKKVNLKDSNLIYVTPKLLKDSLTNLRNTLPAGGGGSGGSSPVGWEEVTYTRTNDNTIVVTNTNNKFKKGMPLKFTISNVDQYAIITNVATNTLTLSGAAFTATVTACYLGPTEKVVKVDFGFYEYYSAYTPTSNNIDDLISEHLGAKYMWGNSDARLVRFGAYSKVIDNAASSLNVYKGSKVLFTATNLSLATADTWLYATSMNTANYKVEFGDAIDVRITRTAATATARNLTLVLWFVLE
jgi:hypothetical protein